eukprot:scaffold45704_cov267-Amphora_coffeaeformis.AAC.1
MIEDAPIPVFTCSLQHFYLRSCFLSSWSPSILRTDHKESRNIVGDIESCVVFSRQFQNIAKRIWATSMMNIDDGKRQEDSITGIGFFCLFDPVHCAVTVTMLTLGIVVSHP